MVEESKRVPLAHPDYRLESVNIHSLMEKIASKRDVYNFLTQECEAYLPKMDTINIYFQKQIARAAKDVSPHVSDCIVCQTISCQGSSRASD